MPATRLSCARSATTLNLFRVPIEQPDLNCGSLQSFLKHCEVGTAIMIRNDNLWMEGSDRVRGLLGRHRVGQIHADERYIDVIERAHFGDTLGVAREVEALSAIGEDVAVAAPLVVEELSRSRAALQVIGGNSLKGPALPGFAVSIGHGLGGG